MTEKDLPLSLLLFRPVLQPPHQLRSLSWTCSRTAISPPSSALLLFTWVAVNGKGTWNGEQDRLPDLGQESTQLLLHSRWVKFDASKKTSRRRQSIRSLLLPVTRDGQKETSSPFKEELICTVTKHSMASLSQLHRNCSQGSPDSGNKTKIQTRCYWKIFSASRFFLPVRFASIFISADLFILCFFMLNTVKFHSPTLFLKCHPR